MTAVVGCPPVEALARLATEPDEQLVSHASGCARCRGLLEEQQRVRQLVQQLPAPALSRSHRAALAAEVMARADFAMADASPDKADAAAVVHDNDDIADELDELAPRRSRVALVVVGIATAAAATFAIVMMRGEAPRAIVVLPEATTVVPPAVASTPAAPARVDVDQPAPKQSSPRTVARATITGATAKFAREDRGGDDTVQLRDGELAVDSVDARSVNVVAGETRVQVASARAAVKARSGVIQTVTVIAGSVEVVASGKRHVIEAGMTWERPAESTPVATASPDDTHATGTSGETAGTARSSTAPTAPTPSKLALEAFRDGWTALRDGRHREAIAAFDRATDPVVAEDAAYWAAVASERAGDRADAAARYTAFAARFPSSPRAAAAKLAAERLTAR